MTTTAQIQIKVKPFTVPNFVIAVGRDISYPLSDLPKETLERMCDEFKAEVMRKAGYLPK